MTLNYQKNHKKTGDDQDTMVQKEQNRSMQTPVANLDSVLDVSYLMGKFSPSKEVSFTEIPLPYANRAGQYLREETLAAFKNMYNEALKDGVSLAIISATRNFDAQKGIWEANWSGKRIVDGKNLATAVADPVERARIILKFSSMPGTSRHHWGTDIDLNSMDPKYFETDTGKKMYDWLVKNASNYGFGQPYCAKGEQRPTGYEEEKWHWSYLPISKQCINAWKNKVTYDDITGFSGSETAEKLKVIENYVMGVNPDCK
jgi:LAS superfamily LD-carboxypeptidase LdcB